MLENDLVNFRNVPIEVKRSGINQRQLNYLFNNWQKYLMLALPIILIFIFSYCPMYGILVAFQKYNIMKGIWGSEWIGLENFRYAFTLPRFWHVVVNTLRISLLSLIFGFPMPIILAILINEMRNARIVKCIQTFSYLPHFLSAAIVGGIVYNLCAPDTGIFNQLLALTGQDNAPFLTDNNWWIATYVVSDIWQGMGWGSIIYIAAIANINHEMFEASIVDGCNRLQRILHIILPSILPTIILMLILSMGGIISVGFDKPYVFGNPIVSDVSEVISIFVYNVGLGQNNYELATVVGLFQSLVGAAMVLTVNAIAKAIGEEGLW